MKEKRSLQRSSGLYRQSKTTVRDHVIGTQFNAFQYIVFSARVKESKAFSKFALVTEINTNKSFLLRTFATLVTFPAQKHLLTDQDHSYTSKRACRGLCW